MKPVQLPQAMSRTRFTHLLKAYGAWPSGWPPAERIAARALVAADADAAAEWQRAKNLDGLLDALPDPARQAADARDAAIQKPVESGLQKLRRVFGRRASR